MGNPLIQRDRLQIAVLDIQERLLPHIENGQEVVDNTSLLVRTAQLLEVPLVVAEHYPKGMGPIAEPLRGRLEGIEPIEKITFGAFGCDAFVKALGSPPQWLAVCGIEAHVCVMQTALQALAHGWSVAAVADAMGSRRRENRILALERLRQAGAVVVSTEMLIFELLERGGTPEFKQVLEWIR